MPGVDTTLLELLADDLRDLFAELARLLARLQATREHMISLTDRLRARG